MSEELKPLPCPFCGGEPRIREFVGATEIHCCNKCPARPKIRIQSDVIRAPTYEQAIAAWNRRASPTPPTTEGREAERDDAMLAALRIVAIDEGEPGADEEVEFIDSVAVARALLSSPRVEDGKPVAWQYLLPNGKWSNMPGDWTFDEALPQYKYRPLYAAPACSLSLPDGEGKEKLATRASGPTAPTDRL